MSWRTVVVTGIAKLDFKMDYLVIRKKEETHKVHLSEIGMLLIESTAISLTAMLLCELAKHKISSIIRIPSCYRTMEVMTRVRKFENRSPGLIWKKRWSGQKS